MSACSGGVSPPKSFGCSRACVRRRGEYGSQSRGYSLRREPRGVLVAEDADGLLELLDLERLLQNRDRSFRENSIEHLAVRIPGDDDNGQLGIDLFGTVVDVVSWAVGQFQIEEKEIELLF